MTRGVLSGLGFGAVVSVLGLGGVSLMLPPPQMPAPQAALSDGPARPAPPQLPTPGPLAPEPAVAEALPIAAPEAPAPQALAPEVPAPEIAMPEGTDPDGTAPEVAANPPAVAPEVAPVVAGPAATITVPAGSEFARGPADAPPAAPAPVAAPARGQAAGPDAPRADDPAAAPPALAETAPAARPAPVPGAPGLAPAPESAELALARTPGAETPIPVPPPGEAAAPLLMPVPADERADAGDPDETAPMDGEPMLSTVAGAGRAARLVSPDGQDIARPLASAPGAPDPAPAAPALPRVIAPGGTGFANAPGVRVGRLPAITSPALEAAAQDETTPDDGPDSALVLDPEAAADLPPLRAHAGPAPLAGEGPIYSVVLIDPGPEAGGLDRDTLKTISFPLTIAIDPTRPDAAQAAADFRAAGLEVAILAAGLPPGATARDIETALEAWRAAIPQAVAVVEPAQPHLQNNRNLSQQLVRILSREGLGLVTQAQGLNAAAQIARGQNLPQASIWRVLDTDRDTAAAIERMLERGKFEAQRSGAVTIMLSGWPQSVAGLLAWHSKAGRSVRMAPVSAVVLGAEATDPAQVNDDAGQ